MKSFAALSLLAVAVSAAPTQKRAQVCNISLVPSVSITTESNGKIRWDLFQNSGFGLDAGTLAWFEENQPDAPALFRAIPSTNGANIFSFQRSTDSQAVLLQDNGFVATPSGGTEIRDATTYAAVIQFIVNCPADCNVDAEEGTGIAGQCTLEVTDGQGNGTNQCVAFLGGSATPVAVATCDNSEAQQVSFFNNF
ncbi:hypothetical protein PUNSTDRAFT_126595 [Punctularia strigosozonata HHB-11173 SS5]|uniref:uncharacterized protein n=1 Tax=Punctularia strigosozonata (strain HHB-11173) TaxID=741275 RepID=UPI0004417378|nr:uncharacterized protein PUNSTDRAFT_126595 [Punctularia strigosozonata HHB-11173 SS5]EIN07555.1 hypothetical protein PUNSTDRAFT_126595 [Punctularia strigosozonata HHB-11173 SS5]